MTRQQTVHHRKYITDSISQVAQNNTSLKSNESNEYV